MCSKVFSTDEDVYLVGGYLRDLIIKGVHSKDLDFVARKNIVPIVNEVAQCFKGKVVELRKAKMSRVVLNNGATLDFSIIDCEIEKDLDGRDFTINAMAWSPAEGLIDPHDGLGDIRKGVVRAVAGQNLKNDPLRLLRAYRFSAELGMGLSRDTRSLIRPLADKIRTAAAERITSELFKLLNSEFPLKALCQALSDGVLMKIIPLSINKLRANIKSVSRLDSILKKLHLKRIIKEFSQGLTLRGLLRLEFLMMGARIDDSHLSVSNDIRDRLEKAGRLYGEYINIRKLNKYSLFELFSSAGSSAWDLLVITGNIKLLKELKRFMRVQDRGIISAEDIMKTTGIDRGPELGRLIEGIKRRQFAGELRNKRAAIGWLVSR